uniref:TetR/AcrR family transcriptional regulator n=1 Tax=Actinomadura sp. CA-154981 TaxID=3240037 RepID=UPI003F4951C1
MAGQGDLTVEARVLATAGRLFSELGYDEVSTDMIAEATGIDLRVVVDLYGGRRGIYMAVMEDAHAQRLAHTEAAFSEFTPDADGLIRLFEAFLDYSLERPQMSALWMQRWLSDASDIPEADQHFGGTVSSGLIARADEVLGDHLDAGMITRMLAWTIHAFVRGGYVDSSGVRHQCDEPAAQLRFRGFLRETIRQLAS